MKLGSNDISSVYLGTNGVSKVYLGSTEVWSAVDPDAQAFFDRVTTAGGTLSATEQTAVNTLVVQMKADGIWSKMKAVYPMVGASAAACAQNLKSSSFTGTFNGGWTFASTGVTPNGTNGYMNTGFNPNNSLTSILSAHIAIYSRTQIRGGCDVSVNTTSELTIAADLNIIGIYGLSNIGTQYAGNLSPNTSIGFFLANRQSATNNKIIQGTTTLATQTATSSSTKPNANVWVGAQNNNNSYTLGTSRQQAFVSIGDGLTDTEASDLYTAVQAFQTTLSRQV